VPITVSLDYVKYFCVTALLSSRRSPLTTALAHPRRPCAWYMQFHQWARFFQTSTSLISRDSLDTLTRTSSTPACLRSHKRTRQQWVYIKYCTAII